MDSCIKDIQQLKYQFTHFEILITYLLLETNIWFNTEYLNLQKTLKRIN